ncbi:MAG: membrane protein insertase YidC, partial [Candidatus Thiodiazotropha endolucinida]|nr:membrane protein insertase YidC [Candidatus Thiodiazotropha taylori]MCW4321218.1 membrane protein insertase YidC [Candidatus Thiodiazotropha taylori]
MDNLRLILFFTLAFLGLLIYQAWQQDYGVPAQLAAEQAAKQNGGLATPQSGEDSGVPTAAVKANLP